MRIISGYAKGLKLFTPPSNNSHIRPTSDRCREALFSILGPRVNSSTVLDLYAGTGAFGLEAISRGASRAVFIDSNNLAISIIKKNSIAVLRSLPEQATQPELQIMRFDLRKDISPLFLDLQSQKNNAYRYNLIFLDPPYDKGYAISMLGHLANGKWLDSNGLIIAEERAKNKLPNQIENLYLSDHRKYGDTGFWFYTLD